MRFLINKIVSSAGKGVYPRLLQRRASTYEGDGKTIAQVMNKDLGTIMISALSPVGFRLNSGYRIIGPVIIFPRTILNWNIPGIENVNEESLSLFTLMSPKVDIIVFGYGDANALPVDVKNKVLQFGKKHNIGLEILPTENAIATFNFLNHEKRFVAGAFLPPKKVTIYDDQDLGGLEDRRQLLLPDD